MDSRYWLVLAVILIVGWFAIGVIYNLRRGNALLRWLQPALPQVGEKTTLRWLGTSVVELVIARAKKPFRRLETLLVLSPRDVPWLWLLVAFQGRHDTLIFRANLDASPHFDFDLADPSAWTGRMTLKQDASQGWAGQPYQGLQLMTPVGMSAPAINCLDSLAEPMHRLAPHYWRFSLRREAPHLEVHIPFPDRGSGASQFITALQELARAVSALS